MRPAVVTVLLLSAVASWNNYFLPLAMLSDNRLFPVTVGLGLWQGIASANNAGSTSLWSLIIMGALVSVIPSSSPSSRFSGTGAEGCPSVA
jgi:multiple sugar transport system permease protein